MGNDSSRVKGPPNQQVSDFMISYWNLNPIDRKHVLQILESRKVKLRTLHEYHNVDIPLEEWSLFADVDMYWKESIKRIDLWKRVRTHIKGFATNGKSLAICFTPEHVNVGKFTEESWNVVLEKAPKMRYQLMVEANGYVENITKFLNDGPTSLKNSNRLDRTRTFDMWMKQGEETKEEKSEEETKEETVNDKIEKGFPSIEEFDKLMSRTQDLIHDLGDENDNISYSDDNDTDNDNTDNDNTDNDDNQPEYMVEFYKKKSDAWSDFFSSIEN
jgi:hypothetical protein